MTRLLLSAVLALVLAGVSVASVVALPFLGGFLVPRVIGVLVPLCVLVWFWLHGRSHGPGWERLTGVRYAHRGLHVLPDAPENSLAAFRRAAEAGYGAELDVRLTADGRLAVVHDAQLFRVCGKNGVVEELTAGELASYRLCGTEERIPFLEQALEIFEDRAPLIVELKTAGGNYAALTKATVACLDKFRIDYCLESFDPRVLVWLRKNRPELLRGQLSQNFWKHPEGLSPWLRLVLTNLLCNPAARPDFVACRIEDRKGLAFRLCRHMGVRSAYWTIRSAEALWMAEAEGAMVIFEQFDPKEEGRS